MFKTIMLTPSADMFTDFGLEYFASFAYGGFRSSAMADGFCRSPNWVIVPPGSCQGSQLRKEIALIRRSILMISNTRSVERIIISNSPKAPRRPRMRIRFLSEDMKHPM